MSVATWLGVRPPDQPVDKWHVSAPVDLMAYAFSWAWVLLPMAFLGDSYRNDYIAIYVLVLAITDVHRHYAFPYIYLDSEVFSHFRTRYLLFPAAMLVLWLASPLLVSRQMELSVAEIGLAAGGTIGLIYVLGKDTYDTQVSQRAYLVGLGCALTGWVLGKAMMLLMGDQSPTVGARTAVNGMFVFSAVWNVYHVYNQKYGILRLYNAKSSSETGIPGWVDRTLIWAWLPLYFAFLVPRYGNYILRQFPSGRRTLRPVFEWVEQASSALLWPSVVLVALSLAAFFYYEWRHHRFRNAPRLWMGLGTTLLASSFLWVHPVKAYLAYAFSHAVEYIVFVWAFQRRHYKDPLPHRPLLARILTHPMLAHGAFILSLGSAFVYFKYVGRWIFKDIDQPQMFGFTTASIVAYYTVYQSLIHFYFDGFLWKMRRPSVRASI